MTQHATKMEISGAPLKKALSFSTADPDVLILDFKVNSGKSSSH
jgi:hypothetical protein